MKLEDDLQRALNRKAAPSDFDSRVLSRIQQGQRAARKASTIRSRSLTWFAAAAAIVAMAAGGARYYEYQRNVAEARRIETEIRLAMHVTNEALATVQGRLRESAR